MRTFSVCFAVVILTVGLTAFLSAGSDAAKGPSRQKQDVKKSERKSRPKSNAQGRRKTASKPGVQKKSVVQRSDEPQLGKTVRLTFTMTNDDGDHSFSVLCAARSFLIGHNAAEADGGNEMKFSGHLKAVDQPNRVFVSFDAFRSHSNNIEGADVTFKLQGSVLFRFGKKIELGKLGEEKLSLTATLVE